MIKKEIFLQNDFFQYKEIDHLIQYMSEYGKFKNIIEEKCFKPSYCKEKFNDETILIPMVAFCNIPLTQVGHFVYYGDYGIGLSREWAIKNNVKPVRYIVDNSSLDVSSITNIIHLKNHLSKEFSYNARPERLTYNGQTYNNTSFYDFDREITELKELTTTNIQFSKYWETEIDVEFEIKEFKANHKQKNIKINCYNEREWRFIPELKSEEYPKIISNKNNSQEPEFKNFSKSNNKPHITEKEYTLKFELNDLKYLLVREGEIDKTIELLKETFDKEEVSDQKEVSRRLEKGELLILTRNKIFRDF